MEDECRGTQAASLCPFQNANADLNTVILHDALFCDRCRDEQILERTKGEEMLFVDRPPYWILPPVTAAAAATSFADNDEGQRKQTEDVERKRCLPLLEYFTELQKTRKTNDIIPQKESEIPAESGIIDDNLSSKYDAKGEENAKEPTEDGRRNPNTSYRSESNRAPTDSRAPELAQGKAHVPAGIELHRLAKQGFSKEEVLQKYIEKQREKAKPKLEDDRVQVDREDMPWAPPFPKALRKYRSVIQKPIEHQRYVAIIANFLNANHPQPRFQQNRQEIRVMDEKLEDERKQYQELVLQILCSRKKSIYTCRNQPAIFYMLDRLQARISTLQCQYGEPIFDEEMKGLTVDAVTILTPKTTLHPGKMPKIILPNERRRFIFNSSVDDISGQYSRLQVDKFPLESDELAMHLAVRYGVRVVMCVSGVLKILCNPWIADSSTHLIPVVVKRYFNERTNRFENVCLVGKPCVEKSVNGPSLWRQYLKLAVKLALYGDMKKDTEEKVPSKMGKGRRRAKRHGSMSDGDVPKNETNTNGADEGRNLMIADEVAGKTQLDTIHGEENGKNQNSTVANDASYASVHICDDILGDIMHEMGNADSDLAKGGIVPRHDLSAFAGADLTKRYTLFSLGHDGIQDIDVIIRANNDGIDSTGNELNVVHKIEYAAEFGAERLDDEEWLRDYFRCKLKCASQLVRFRIHHTEQHLLQKERYSENMLTANKPDLRKLKDAYLKKEQLREIKFDERLPLLKDAFRGIDEHLVLVYHIVQKRIPASFGARKDKKANSSRNESNNNSSRGARRAQNREGTSPNQRSRRRGRRNRLRRKLGGGPRDKRSRFVDYDAPHVPRDPKDTNTD